MANPRRLSTGTAYTPIGAKTSKINILSRSHKRDSAGEFMAPDVFAPNVWAKIQFIAPKYTEKPQQTVTEATHKIVISYIARVTSEMTVQDAVTGAIYNITAANDPDGRRVELWLMCYQRNDGKPGVQA